MIDTLESCTVASTITCNSATTPLVSATVCATNNATVDLLALSIEVLRRNECNQRCNLGATSRLHRHASESIQKNCVVALPKERNAATQELYSVIKQISAGYGGDEEQCLEEYFEEVLRDWSYDMDRAIACFRDVAKRIPSVNNSR